MKVTFHGEVTGTGVGKGVDKVQWPLEICSPIHSLDRAHHLCQE